MVRNTIIYALLALIFGIGIMAQPAVAVECAKTMGCMPIHKGARMPGAGNGNTCACAQNNPQLSQSACPSFNRHLKATAANSSHHPITGLAPAYTYAWAMDDALPGSYAAAVNAIASPQCPAFILHQSFLC